MRLELRPYQERAASAVIEHFRKTCEPACVVLPTGSGKSLVIAELARRARGKVLVLAHVKELCEQNHAKFQAVTQAPDARTQPAGGGGADAAEQNQPNDLPIAGIYSAGLGQKDPTRQVTFASVQSVARNLSAFREIYSLVIIDECHRVSGDAASQYGQIIAQLRRSHAEVKILGLTATPFRLGVGWIYRFHQRGYVRTEDARLFDTCVFEISLREMVAQGYLTPPSVEDTPIAQYDFSTIESGRYGDYPDATVNELLVRHRRVTHSIVEDVVRIARKQARRGVMLFAATVDHAREVYSYLPKGEAALILGETVHAERDAQLIEFQNQRLRYLVNVAVLTTGFDAPHVDLIALLRATQSISLFQQIVGRGLRLYPEKTDCLIMDYAGNGYDIYSPEVGERKPTADSIIVTVRCPDCEFDNSFWGQVDEEGRVLEHFGRRCQRLILNTGGQRKRCSYRFRFKECGHCNAENDIAARRCHQCEAAIVDPDDQLRRALRLKDALVLRVAGMTLGATNERVKITYTDEDGTSLSESFDFGHANQRAVFNRLFARRLASGRHPLQLTKAAQVLELETLIPRPDFVVARKQKTRPGRPSWHRIQERLFDYDGPFRKAEEA